MSGYRVTRRYPQPPELVWRALTDPELVARWTATGRGGRPVGFTPEVGTAFQFVARPLPGWRGLVDCTVTEVDAPRRLSYTWVGDEGGAPSTVTYLVEPDGSGTRLVVAHTGFVGVGGFLLSRLLEVVRRRMLADGLPPVLAELDRTSTS